MALKVFEISNSSILPHLHLWVAVCKWLSLAPRSALYLPLISPPPLHNLHHPTPMHHSSYGVVLSFIAMIYPPGFSHILKGQQIFVINVCRKCSLVKFLHLEHPQRKLKNFEEQNIPNIIISWRGTILEGAGGCWKKILFGF